MNRWYGALAGIFLLIGFLFGAWYKELILFRFSSIHFSKEQPTKPRMKKKYVLSFWRTNKWIKETVELIVSDDVAQTISRISNAWLTLLDEEGELKKRVIVQAVLLSSAQEAYISFDRNPFEKSASTHEKLLFIEGLLKTLREGGVSIKRLYFQAHYQPLQDYHLDFLNAWPLTGFIGC